MKFKTLDELKDVDYSSSLKSSPHSGRRISSLTDQEVFEENKFTHRMMIDTIMKQIIFDNLDEEINFLNSLADSYCKCCKMQQELLDHKFPHQFVAK